MKKSVAAAITSEMSDILNSENHRKLFTKHASIECNCDNCDCSSDECKCKGKCKDECKSCMKKSKASLKDVIDILVNASLILDNNGFDVLSQKVSLDTNFVMKEAKKKMKKKKEDPKEKSEEDKNDLRVGDLIPDYDNDLEVKDTLEVDDSSMEEYLNNVDVVNNYVQGLDDDVFQDLLDLERIQEKEKLEKLRNKNIDDLLLDKPSDYEECGDCGFDHGYEQDEAIKAHKKDLNEVDDDENEDYDDEELDNFLKSDNDFDLELGKNKKHHEENLFENEEDEDESDEEKYLEKLIDSDFDLESDDYEENKYQENLLKKFLKGKDINDSDDMPTFISKYDPHWISTIPSRDTNVNFDPYLDEEELAPETISDDIFGYDPELEEITSDRYKQIEKETLDSLFPKSEFKKALKELDLYIQKNS